MDNLEPLYKTIHRYIDHTNVKAEAQPDDIDRLCAEAKQYHFAAVAVNPHYVKRCADLLASSTICVACAVGFPFGANTTDIKAAETAEAIANGANEIDMVINVGELKSGNDNFVIEDIRAVVDIAKKHHVPVKVVIETHLLTNNEKIRACKAACLAGADFVKTSTGTRPTGATEADVRLMAKAVGNQLQVKAAGDICSWETAQKMIAAGATRLGTSSGIKIIAEALQEAGIRKDNDLVSIISLEK